MARLRPLRAGKDTSSWQSTISVSGLEECTEDCTAITTANFILNNILLKFGAPVRILTDQAKNYEAKVIQELTQLYWIEKIRSSAYHAEGNGSVERENCSMEEMLRIYTIEQQFN